MEVFEDFQQRFADWDEPLQNWLQAEPNSHVAHVATAMFLLGQLWRVRGHGTSATVSDEDDRQMDLYCARAMQLAEASLNLAEKPLMAFVILGHLNHIKGNVLSLEKLKLKELPEWYSKGIQMFPASLELRSIQMHTLSIHWGGSKEHMQIFLEQQKDLPQEVYVELEAQFHAEMAHYAFAFAQDMQEALWHMGDALERSERYLPRYIHYLKTYGQRERLQKLLKQRFQAELEAGSVLPYGVMDALVWSVRYDKEASQKVYGLLLQHSQQKVEYAYELLGQLLEWHPEFNSSFQDAAFWYEMVLETGDPSIGERLVHLWILQSGEDVEQVCREVVRVANKGSAFCKMLLWRYFDVFQAQLALSSKAKYICMLDAAFHGDNLSREAAMEALLKGEVEEQDGHWSVPDRPQKPSAQSLEWAGYFRDVIRISGGFDGIARPSILIQNYFTQHQPNAAQRTTFLEWLKWGWWLWLGGGVVLLSIFAMTVKK